LIWIFEALKACFRRKSLNVKERSPFSNEEVVQVPKDQMMERIADVVKKAREKKEKKGRRAIK